MTLMTIICLKNSYTDIDKNYLGNPVPGRERMLALTLRVQSIDVP